VNVGISSFIQAVFVKFPWEGLEFGFDIQTGTVPQYGTSTWCKGRSHHIFIYFSLSAASQHIKTRI